MALVNSNTYTEPTAATALTTARLQYNNTLRSLLTNFSSPTAPTSINMTASGNPFNVPDGTLHRSETNHAMYVSDSLMVKNSPVGGNFTRVGLGNRIENSIIALGANAESYEIGELVATVSENGSLAANSRLYLVTSNALTTGSTANFLDIGAPQGYSVGLNSNVLFSGQQILSPRIYATTNLAVGTTTPDSTMHVVGVAKVTGNVTLLSNLVVSGNTNIGAKLTVADTSAFTGAVVTTTDVTIGRHAIIAEEARVTGNVVAFSNVVVSGDITASGDINTASDRRVKTNIVPIDNALAKALQIEGVYYNRVGDDTRKVGVIAQDIERILPEVVSGSDLKSVSYGNIAGLLIEAIKELNKELQELKSSIK
jgi:cytoskeletal protein CcmA (bactofilin family)